jgi:GST-like protein
MDASEELELYYWPTPNGFKVTIMLEELGVPYKVMPIDITAGDQHSDEFSLISPNNKIPAIRDPHPGDGRDSATLFESGAILLYLAEKYGEFIPEDAQARSQCMQWLFWQVGGLGPMAGQAHHFRLYASEKIEYAIDRYTAECKRLYTVLDKALAGREYLTGQYSIADIACLPWIFRHERQDQKLEDFPNLKDWYDRLMARNAVKAGLEVAAQLRDDAAFTGAMGREALFHK